MQVVHPDTTPLSIPLDTPDPNALRFTDPFALEVLRDPYPYLGIVREQSPCLHVETRDTWLVTRHSDVERVLLRPEVFASTHGTGFTPVRRPVDGGVIIASDGEFHRRIRRTVQPRFNKASVDALRPALKERVERQVDAAHTRPSFDFVSAVAEPVAVWIVCEVLGVEAPSIRDFVEWSDAGFRLLSPLEGIDVAAVAKRFFAGLEWMKSVIEQGSYRPDGVIAAIALARREGTLDLEEAVSLANGILVAGVDTSVASLATAVELLARHGEQWRMLRADPGQAPRAFEESLRFDGPILYWFRQCMSDTEVAGVPVPAGARVMLSLSATGRDPRRFPEGDRFDIRHDPAGHIAFGKGEHLCLGAQVARLEGAVVLEVLARRFASLELDAEPTRRRVPVLRAYERLPVRPSTG